MESVGPAGDHTNLGVQPFDDAVGQSPSDVRDDLAQVPADGAGDLDESRETTATRPAQSFVEFICDHIGLVAVQDAGERFFE